MSSAGCHLWVAAWKLVPEKMSLTILTVAALLGSMVFSAAIASPAIASAAYLGEAVRYHSNCAVQYGALFSYELALTCLQE